MRFFFVFGLTLFFVLNLVAQEDIILDNLPNGTVLKTKYEMRLLAHTEMKFIGSIYTVRKNKVNLFIKYKPASIERILEANTSFVFQGGHGTTLELVKESDQSKKLTIYHSCPPMDWKQNNAGYCDVLLSELKKHFYVTMPKVGKF